MTFSESFYGKADSTFRGIKASRDLDGESLITLLYSLSSAVQCWKVFRFSVGGLVYYFNIFNLFYEVKCELFRLPSWFLIFTNFNYIVLVIHCDLCIRPQLVEADTKKFIFCHFPLSEILRINQSVYEDRTSLYFYM